MKLHSPSFFSPESLINPSSAFLLSLIIGKPYVSAQEEGKQSKIDSLLQKSSKTEELFSLKKRDKFFYSETMAPYRYPQDESFVLIDVETATKANDRVCAIGFVFVKEGYSEAKYSLINPGTHITNTSIHGIRDKDLAGAPTLEAF